MKFKLKEFDTVAACDAGAELQLKNPFTEALTDKFITLVGVDSNTFQEAQRRAFDARVAKADTTVTKNDLDAEVCGILADCTRSWRMKDDDGKDIPFSREAALEIYMECPRIKDQVNAFIGGVANFRRD